MTDHQHGFPLQVDVRALGRWFSGIGGGGGVGAPPAYDIGVVVFEFEGGLLKNEDIFLRTGNETVHKVSITILPGNVGNAFVYSSGPSTTPECVNWIYRHYGGNGHYPACCRYWLFHLRQAIFHLLSRATGTIEGPLLCVHIKAACRRREFFQCRGMFQNSEVRPIATP